MTEFVCGVGFWCAWTDFGMKRKYPLCTVLAYIAAVSLVLLCVYVMETKLHYPGLTFYLQQLGRNLPGGARDGSNTSGTFSPTQTTGTKLSDTVSLQKGSAAVKQSSPVLRNKQETMPSSADASPTPEWYLLRSFQGRLGNVLFQFSSALCIAELNHLTLMVKDAAEMRYLRYYPGVRLVQEAAWKKKTLSLSPLQHHKVDICCRFNASVMSLVPLRSHHSLTGYFQSWKYLEPCRARVKEATLFKDSITSSAVRIVNDLRKKLPLRILIGVHVRREDMLNIAEQKVGRKVAPPDYFRRAMTYFRDKFSDAVSFVVVSSSPDWFRTKVSNSSEVVHLKRSQSAAVDMEVLSRMDHLIVSVGTFSWWCAYKNNGTVVYYKDFYVPGSRYGQQLENNAADYFLPQWIPL